MTSLDIRSKVTWRNYPRNLQQPLRALYTPWNHDVGTPEDFRLGVRNLLQIVRGAEAAKGRVRAAGGTWSMAPIATTRDFIVNTLALNMTQAGEPRQPRQLPAIAAHHAAPGVSPATLFHAQCGTTIRKLNRKLTTLGLTLPTQGASDGQSIAGATSTGTHGSGLSRASLADYVRAVHLITEGGKQLWVERESAPITNDSFAELMGATPKRDDALFTALACGFGSFGIIHSLVMQVEPIFWLKKYRRRRDLSVALRTALRTLDLAPLQLPEGGKPYHFEVVIDPYATGPRQKGAYVTAMYRKANAGPRRPPAGQATGLEPGDPLGRVLAGLFDVRPQNVPSALKLLLRQSYGESTEHATPAEIWSQGPTAGSAPRFDPISTELGVALADAERALDAILGEIQRSTRDGYYFPGILAFRYVQPTSTLLAFNQFSPTCTIEIPALGHVDGTNDFYKRLFAVLRRAGIAFTLHWGQVNHLTAPDVQRMYGQRARDWLAARQALLTPRGRNTFANAFLERTGLAK